MRLSCANAMLRLCRNLASFSGVPWDQMGRSESMPTCQRIWLVMDPSPNQRRPLRNQRTKTVVTHKGLRDAHFADQASRKYAMTMAGVAVSCVRTTTKLGITCSR